jgi:hypothetical protein
MGDISDMAGWVAWGDEGLDMEATRDDGPALLGRRLLGTVRGAVVKTSRVKETTLTPTGWVARTESGSRYALGPSLLDLGALKPRDPGTVSMRG